MKNQWFWVSQYHVFGAFFLKKAYKTNGKSIFWCLPNNKKKKKRNRPPNPLPPLPSPPSLTSGFLLCGPQIIRIPFLGTLSHQALSFLSLSPSLPLAPSLPQISNDDCESEGERDRESEKERGRENKKRCSRSLLLPRSLSCSRSGSISLAQVRSLSLCSLIPF